MKGRTVDAMDARQKCGIQLSAFCGKLPLGADDGIPSRMKFDRQAEFLLNNLPAIC
jgi:hypothetical protein